MLPALGGRVSSKWGFQLNAYISVLHKTQDNITRGNVWRAHRLGLGDTS